MRPGRPGRELAVAYHIYSHIIISVKINMVEFAVAHYLGPLGVYLLGCPKVFFHATGDTGTYQGWKGPKLEVFQVNPQICVTRWTMLIP